MSSQLLRLTLGMVAALAVVVLPACSDDGNGKGGTASGGSTTTAAPQGGIQNFASPSRNHVQGPISYPMVPPVGGDHNAVWQNCGFYSKPVEPERAVHSMEHGAVWITYRPDLPADQVDILKRLAQSRPYVLVSPWNDTSLPAAVVASGWAVQLKLASASDPALADFVQRFAGGGRAPEPGAACTGAVGTPEQ